MNNLTTKIQGKRHFFLGKHLFAVPQTRIAVSLWLLSCSHGALTALIIILEQQQTRINQSTAQMAGDCFHCSEFPVAFFSFWLGKTQKNRNRMHLKRHSINVIIMWIIMVMFVVLSVSVSSTDWMFSFAFIDMPMICILIWVKTTWTRDSQTSNGLKINKSQRQWKNI